MKDGAADPDKGTVNSLVYNFNTADGKIALASGFTWFITQNVTFDATWSLTGDLLKGFGHQLEKNKNIWETVNKVLVHDVYFMLSAKL